MLGLYRTFTRLMHPLLPLYLRRRAAHGKEDTARMGERFGCAGTMRPAGALLWFHAASVGEALAVLPLLEAIAARYPEVNLLLTTVTVTSAQLVAGRLPGGVTHQYAPLDTPQAVGRFLAHWRPDMAVWVESELWPNMIIMSHATNIPLFLVNGRMSARSAQNWQRWPAVIAPMLHSFTQILASGEEDARRFAALGAIHVSTPGNLKFSAPPLPADPEALAWLRAQVGARACWLAASTHAGEESIAAGVHQQLKRTMPHLLTVIVPRHSARGEEIAHALREAGLKIAQRSVGERITADTDVYLADTMGELGLFYRSAKVAFIGGSLVPHGGQNPFEAARLGCALVYGTQMQNFMEFCALLEAAQAACVVDSPDMLAQKIAWLLGDDMARSAQVQSAQKALQKVDGVLTQVLHKLTPSIERIMETHRNENP